jgi:hypothetical protein
MRLRAAGLYAGYYDPAVSVHHFVPACRVTRRYFRRWFFWHGKTQARMLDDLYIGLDMSRIPRVAGIPRFACRQGLQQFVRWLKSLAGRDRLATLIDELRVLQYAGFFIECYRRSRITPSPEPVKLRSPHAFNRRIVKSR